MAARLDGFVLHRRCRAAAHPGTLARHRGHVRLWRGHARHPPHQSALENQRPHDGHRSSDRGAPLCLWFVGPALRIDPATRHMEPSVPEETHDRSGPRGRARRFCAYSPRTLAFNPV